MNIEGKVLYSLKSGITLVISPPTLTIRNALMLEAFLKYPDPNPQDYARQTATPTLGGGTAVTDGKESDEYKHARGIAKIKRSACLESALFRACIDTEHDRDELVASYSRQLSQMRQFTTIMPEDDWEALLKTFLAEAEELNVIRQIMSRNLPLTEEETAEGRKFFRVDVSGDGLRDVPAGEQPPNHPTAQSRQDKRADERSGSGKRMGNRPRSRR